MLIKCCFTQLKVNNYTQNEKFKIILQFKLILTYQNLCLVMIRLLVQDYKTPYTHVNLISQKEFEDRRNEEQLPPQHSQITPPAPPKNEDKNSKKSVALICLIFQGI